MSKVFLEQFGKLKFNVRDNKYFFTTKDLVQDHLLYWNKYLNEFIKKKTNLLEIGSLQGQSATWFIDNILIHDDSKIFCVDPFNLHKKIPDKDIFLMNIAATNNGHKVNTIVDYSNNIVPKLDIMFDIIYIDGSHEYADVLQDANNCWKLLNKDGIMIFDDYRMSLLYTKDRKGVKPAVDEFLENIKDQYELLNTNFKPKARNIIGYQCIIKKLI